MMKNYRIIVCGAGVPYEEIGPVFNTRSQAESWAHDNQDPLDESQSVADAIASGDYRVIATEELPIVD